MVNSSYLRLGFFVYKDKTYYAGTEFVYNGTCFVNGQPFFLENQRCKFLYSEEKTYFQAIDTICCCNTFEFNDRIVAIIEHAPPQNPTKKFYLADDAMVKTLWYVFLMLVATLFNDRVGLWLLITLIYVTNTFRKKK